MIVINIKPVIGLGFSLSVLFLVWGCVSKDSSHSSAFKESAGAEANFNPPTTISEALTRERLFDERLLWTGASPPAEAESAALADAITQTSFDPRAIYLSALESFLTNNPASAWRPSLHVNMGHHYRRIGRISFALYHWQSAWELTRQDTSRNGKKIGDSALAHWTRLLASLGHYDQLQEIFVLERDRVLDGGPLSAKWERTGEAAAVMRDYPGIAFKCGTFALESVATLLYGDNFDRLTLRKIPSPRAGFTMKELSDFSTGLNLRLVAVERPEGAPLIVPSIVHWNNHYAAIIDFKRESGLYRVVDPTFERLMNMSEEGILAEASGYFLIPQILDDGSWRKLSDAEAALISGRGYPNFYNENANSNCTNCCPPSTTSSSGGGGPSGGPGPSPPPSLFGKPPPSPFPPPPPPPPGCTTCPSNAPSTCTGSSCSQSIPMVQFWVGEPTLNLFLWDEPMAYQTSKGQRISLRVDYKTRREGDYGIFDQAGDFGFGMQWDCTWYAFVDKVGSSQDATAYLPGGSEFVFYDVTSGESLNYYNNAKLTEHSTNSTVVGYTLVFADGSKLLFEKDLEISGSKHRYFMTEHHTVDGVITQFVYDTNTVSAILRHVVDGDGRTNFLAYSAGITGWPYLVSHVTNAFGAVVQFGYDNDGHLTSITDVEGLQSAISYDARGYPATLVTPYGTTSFTITNKTISSAHTVDRFISVTLPNQSKQVYAFVYYCHTNAAGQAWMTPYTDIPNVSGHTFDTNTVELNSFYWNPKLAVGLPADLNNLSNTDFFKARMRHWLGGGGAYPGNVQAVDTLALERDFSPDGTVEGQKTWYDHAGKPAGNVDLRGTQIQPKTIATILPNGQLSSESYARNDRGHPTIVTNTYGDGTTIRINTFSYDTNNFALLEVRGPNNELEAGYGYNAYGQLTKETNAVGEVTTYNYDGTTRKITSIEYPTGLTTTYNYGGDGFVSSTVDSPSGGTNSFTWENALIETHTDERGLTRTFFYDNLHRVTGVSFPDSTTLSNRYDKLDIVATKDRLGRWTNFGYDSMRNLTHVTNALGYLTKYGYCDCGSLETITNALGQITTFGYDNAGRRTTITYPDSSVKSFRYDKMSRLTNEQNSLGIVGYLYNNQGLVVSITNAAGLVAGYGYDIEDNPIYVTNSSGVKTVQEFDLLNRVVKKTYPDTGIEQFEYSTRGLISYTNQIGKITRYTYDESGNKLSEQTPNSEIIYFTNNAAGDLIALKDHLAKVTIWTNDSYGRVISKKLADNVLVLTNNYDASGQLTQRWSTAKGITLYSYDAVGSLTNVNYPASTDLQFQYDALNRVTNMVDAVGTTKYTYDLSGGLGTEDGPWASDTVTYDYNSSLLRSGLTLDQPASSAWFHGYDYDASGRLSGFAAEEGDYTYTYRGAGNQVTNIALPNTSHITNGYDSVGRLTNTSLKHSGGTVLNSHGYVHNYAGQRTRQNRTDGSYVLYTYDNNGQLKSGWGYTSSDVVINSERRGYVFDAAWNMTKKTNDASETTFTVNNLNQATAVGATGITYDGNGNRITRGTTYTYGWDDENQLLKIELTGAIKAEFVYDGRQRRKIRKEYYWSVISWVLQSETRYIYDGMRVIEERDGSNNPLVRYTRGLDLSGSLEGAGGIGGLLSRTPYGTATYAYYHADGGGNITAMVDSGQNLVANYRYDPFGSLISSSGTLSAANLYRFSSKEVHATYGFYYYGYRYYDPIVLRWLNRDPLGDKGSLVFAVEKMQSMEDDKFFTMAQVLNISVEEFTKVNANLYGFVANDPLTKIDPLGLDWLSCMAKCIEKNDPLNDKCKIGLTAVGGTFPYRWVRPIFGPKLGTPLTTVPSVGGKIVGGGVEKCMRGVGRVFSPAFVGYGLGMAGIECACAAQCARDSKSFDW